MFMYPGDMELTRIPCTASSAAIQRVIYDMMHSSFACAVCHMGLGIVDNVSGH